MWPQLHAGHPRPHPFKKVHQHCHGRQGLISSFSDHMRYEVRKACNSYMASLVSMRHSQKVLADPMQACRSCNSSTTGVCSYRAHCAYYMIRMIHCEKQQHVMLRLIDGTTSFGGCCRRGGCAGVPPPRAISAIKRIRGQNCQRSAGVSISSQLFIAEQVCIAGMCDRSCKGLPGTNTSHNTNSQGQSCS